MAFASVWVALWCILVFLGRVAGITVANNNTDCRSWTTGTAQDVVVAPGTTLAWGAECNSVLLNVNLTLFCYPNVTIYIHEWSMEGGYLRIVGPPDAPSNVSDVAVFTVSSSIRARDGPAVGVVLGYGWLRGPARWTVKNVTLVALMSTLTSTSTTSASSLGCTALDPTATQSVDLVRLLQLRRA